MDNDGDALRLSIELSKNVVSPSAWAATTVASDESESAPWVWPGRLLAFGTTIAAGASIGFGASYYRQHLSQTEEKNSGNSSKKETNFNDDGHADWRKVMDDARRMNFFVRKSWTVHESNEYGAATKAMICMFPREFRRQAMKQEDAVGNIGRPGEIADIENDQEGNPQMACNPKDWTTIPDASALFMNLEENNLGYGDQGIGMRNNCYAHAAVIAYRNVWKTIYLGNGEDPKLLSYRTMLKRAIHKNGGDDGGDWGQPDHALKRLEREYDRGVMWVKLDDAEPTIQDVFCHQVILSFWTTAEGLTWCAAGDLTTEPPAGPRENGHAVYVESYDFAKEAYLCLNTWGSGKERGNKNHGRFWFKPEAAMKCQWLVVRRDLVQMEINETPMENVEKMYARGGYYEDTDWYYVNRWYAKYNTSVMAFEVLPRFRQMTDERDQELAYLAIDMDEWVSAMKQLAPLLESEKNLSEQDERRRGRLLRELLYGEDSPWMKPNQVVEKIWLEVPNHHTEHDDSDSDSDDETVGWVPGWRSVDPRGTIGRRMAGSTRRTRTRTNEDGRVDMANNKMSEEELTKFVIDLAHKQIGEAKSAPVYPVEKRQHLVIFVHGYKTPTSSVDERITEIDMNLGTDEVICVPFDWVSLNTYVRYHDDQDQVRQVLKYFIAYLKAFRDDGFFTQIDLISHSMGNYLVDLAMNYKDEETGHPIGAEMFRGSNIVSCAADVAYTKFIETVKQMEPIVKSWTHYFNPSDKALTASPILNIRELDPYRAGTRALEIDSDNVNSVKVVNYVGKDDWPRHGYVFDATCLKDIRRLLIERRMHPRERNDLTRSDGDEYWELYFPVVKRERSWLNSFRNPFGLFGHGSEASN